MRIAVFSDIHGNLQALNAILDDIKKENFDEVICLGDVIGLGPKPKECLELLLNSNVTILAGNHDLYYRDGIEIDDEITNIDEIAHHRWVHRTIKDYVDKNDIKFDFPLTKEMNINGKRIMFAHYMLSKDTSKDPYPFETCMISDIKGITECCKDIDVDYLFVGHEHHPYEVHINDKTIYCVGSSGCVTDNKTFYTIIDINDDVNITRKELTFDREGLIKDINSFEYPDQEMIKEVFFGISD